MRYLEKIVRNSLLCFSLETHITLLSLVLGKFSNTHPSWYILFEIEEFIGFAKTENRLALLI